MAAGGLNLDTFLRTSDIDQTNFVDVFFRIFLRITIVRSEDDDIPIFLYQLSRRLFGKSAPSLPRTGVLMTILNYWVV